MDPTAPSAASVDADRCPGCDHEVGSAWLVCAWCGRALAVAAELPVGSRLAGDRYEVLGVLGRGGFGITYEMADLRLQRRVAVKELFPDAAVRHGSLVLTPPQARGAFAEARERFLREARVLARFTHPGIVRVYEVFEEHGTAYLVMELLEGRNLVELLHEGGRPFSEEQVLEVAGRVAMALRPVHAVDVLHRDVNPSNVMLTDGGRIVVIDFGLARAFEPDRTVGMTRVVTPGYAPIEQYRGEGRFGAFTDVYGLAATCYRLATGTVPPAALDRDGGVAITPPQVRNPAISKAVGDAILDGLEFEPSHRPQDLDAFLARLGIAPLPAGVRSPLIDAFPPRVPIAPAPPAPAGAAAGRAGDPVADAEDGPWPPAPHAQQTFVQRDPEATVVPLDPEATVVPLDPDATFVPGVDRTLPASDATRPAPAAAGPAPRRGAAPVTATALRPDGSARIIGPGARGIRKLTVPVSLVAVALASVAPVTVTVLFVLVALPWLATIGGVERTRLRRAHGLDDGARARVPAAVGTPASFVANMARSLLRASPVLAIGVVLLVAWFGLAAFTDQEVVVDAVLRAVGVIVMVLLLAASREGSPTFPTGLGLEVLAARLAPDGRANQRVLVLWLVSVLVITAALWLHPDPFPL